MLCAPRNVHTILVPYHGSELKALQLPSKCPVSVCGGPHTAVPDEPTAFASYCVKNGMAFVDAISIAPAWVFDVQGKKVGAKPHPYRITDHVTQFYIAKNPIAMGGRFDTSLSERAMSAEPAIKREVEDDEQRPASKELDRGDEAVKTEAGVEDGKPPACCLAIRSIVRDGGGTVDVCPHGSVASGGVS